MSSTQIMPSFMPWILAAIQTVIVGFLGWTALTLISMQTELEAQSVKLEFLRESSADRYHGTDAARDFAVRDVRMDEMSRRIDRVEAACTPALSRQ